MGLGQLSMARLRGVWCTESLQGLGSGLWPSCEGSLAPGRGVPYTSWAVLPGLLKGLVDHGADKWFLFQAGEQKEWGGEEHVSVLLRAMFVCFVLSHPEIKHTAAVLHPSFASFIARRALALGWRVSVCSHRTRPSPPLFLLSSDCAV